MKKILIFVIAIAMSVAHAAVRDGNVTQRTSTQKRISTTTTERVATERSAVVNSARNTINRGATNSDTSDPRPQGTVINRALAPQKGASSGVILSRATTKTQNTTAETRTGASYETCKSAFFTCMDQFCALKNDDYRRCSCSNRIYNMEKQRDALNDVGEQLTVFTENLDVVGLTAAQATAMKTASEGESALSTDTSASKALLQAIMNSISGGDTSVSGKYSDLNTINMSYDLTTVFTTDVNQIVASYNGQELYGAVYSRCRRAVTDDCNNASLQRAVNAYLMAIEQDCNTVQTAIDEKQSKMKAAIREGSAMLDLARVENRRNHNADDITTCINNVESAVLSEEVCGANYHKCLDNGEFIDISTGAPIIGVVKFYELGKLLTFEPGIEAANQRLSKRPNNRVFVSNFEKRTKKFAEPALDKCTEIADEVWSEYLDKALLAIYYAQQSKVSQIKQGCLDLVSSCYVDSDTSITAAMSALIGSGLTILQPDKIALTTKMCADYVDSCNNMFHDDNTGNIITDYVNNRQDTDTLTACRAIVKQCFDKYGGTGYENFYYPYSGLFQPKTDASDYVMTPGDWFTLYDLSPNDGTSTYKSPCATQLTTVPACNNSSIIEQAFGGFDRMYTKKVDSDRQDKADKLSFTVTGAPADLENDKQLIRYGIRNSTEPDESTHMQNRVLRPVGVATEIYNQIIDTLTTQCTNINGRFVERQFIKENLYGDPYKEDGKNNICLWKPKNPGNQDTTSSEQTQYNQYITLSQLYHIIGASDEDIANFTGEDMCPRDYNLNVDSYFWGACLCWENGGRRSKNGKSATCLPILPVETSEGEQDPTCSGQTAILGNAANFTQWCTQSVTTDNQVCPYGYKAIVDEANPQKMVCANVDNETDKPDLKLLPEAQK